MKITISPFQAPVANSFFILICIPALFFSSLTQAQENLLKRRVSLAINDQPLEFALMEISDKAQFTFSYDASILEANKKTSVTTENETVKSNLEQILPQNIDYKVSGNHLILMKRPQELKPEKIDKFTITGIIVDKRNDRPIPEAVVFEISSLISSVSDQEGRFSVTVPAEYQKISLSINKTAYEDSIIFLLPKDQSIKIFLNPDEKVLPTEKIGNKSPSKSPIESLSIVQSVVPSQSRVRTSNTNMIREKVMQVSFIPGLGSNYKMSGAVKNNISFNILAGYSYGVDAFELGGLFNVVRNDVDGVQIGGTANLVGRKTRGFQLAGIFNHNRGSVNGVQLSGVHNMIVDTLRGVQFSGVNNILNGGMKGWQIAGVNNLTTKNVDGVQFSGVTNVAAQDVKMLQFAGVTNYCNNVKGVQFAGVGNIAKKDVRGLQFAGVFNWGKDVNAVQLAGVFNISKDTVSGAQISGIFNYAKYTKSSQIGFINFADTASGTPIGFISIIKKGFRTPEFSVNEVFPANVAFKIGVKRFYNIFSASIGNWYGRSSYAFGYGIGTEKQINKKKFLAIEYTSNWINEDMEFQEDLNSLHKVNINYGFRLKDKLALTIGPSLNIMLSEWQGPETGEYLTRLAPYTLYEGNWGSTQAQIWVGGKVAVHW